MMKLIGLALLAAAIATTGCSSFTSAVIEEYTRDHRDAPWDPRPGHQLIDQTPNWDRNSRQRCCGHLKTCEPHQTPRC